MNDNEIIQMFFTRNEDAIQQTAEWRSVPRHPGNGRLTLKQSDPEKMDLPAFRAPAFSIEV